MAKRLWKVAQIRGVFFHLVLMFRLALWSTSSITMSIVPFRDAMCSGVIPSRFCQFTGAPPSRSVLVSAVFPL